MWRSAKTIEEVNHYKNKVLKLKKSYDLISLRGVAIAIQVIAALLPLK